MSNFVRATNDATTALNRQHSTVHDTAIMFRRSVSSSLDARRDRRTDGRTHAGPPLAVKNTTPLAPRGSFPQQITWSVPANSQSPGRWPLNRRWWGGGDTKLSTQPPTISGTGNGFPPKIGDALWLGSKGGMAHSKCGCTFGRHTELLCDPRLTRAIRERALTLYRTSIERCRNVLFALLTYTFFTVPVTEDADYGGV